MTARRIEPPTRIRPPALIIFDCDGVLVDSEPITNRVFFEMVRELGLSLTYEEIFDQFVGRSTPYCLALLATMLGRPLPEDFSEQYHLRTIAALQHDLKPVAGISDLLDTLDAESDRLLRGVERQPRKNEDDPWSYWVLPRLAGRLFSVTEVAEAKPAPDIFLHAAARYGAAPSECYVVEDTPTGVIAAVDAGMTVFGYCALTPKVRLLEAGAHYTVEDLSLLPGLWFGAEPRRI